MIPLGRYSKCELAASWLQTYGSGPQGVTFNVKADVTTVPQPTTGSEEKNLEYWISNGGPTSNTVHGKDGTGNHTLEGTGGVTTGDGTTLSQDGQGNYAWPTAYAEYGKGEAGTSQGPYCVGHITNSQAGLALGMGLLLAEDEVTTETEGMTVSRQPALIHFTDGESTDLAWIQTTNAAENPQPWQKSLSNWNNVNWQYDLAYNSTVAASGNNEYNASQMGSYTPSNGADAGKTFDGSAVAIIFQTLMTADYYKNLVEKHYNKGASTSQAIEFPCYSVYASATPIEDQVTSKPYNAAKIRGILDPGEYFKKDPTAKPSEPEGQGGESYNETGGPVTGWPYQTFINGAYNLYTTFKGNSSVTQTYSKYTAGPNSINVSLSASTKDLGTHSIKVNSSEVEVDAITPADLDENLNYVKQYYGTTDFDSLGGIFQQIIALIQGQVFDPVAGMNAAGVTDSVTYFDPVGKYMEVKNPYTSGMTEKQPEGATPIAADLQMVHLGKMYGLVRTGVYDYQWNDLYMSNGGSSGSSASGGTFKSGWYKGDPVEGDNGGVTYSESLPEGCGSAQAAWEAGWVYRFDYATTQQFVSTLKGSDGVGGLTDIQKNTVYTMYRFDWVQQSQTYNTSGGASGDASDDRYYFGGSQGQGSTQDASAERNLWLMNPAYAESAAAQGIKWEENEKGLGYVITNPTQEKINADVAAGKDPPIGAYRIGDFRVWVEDNGDFVSGGELAKDTGYDQALYFNLPSAAIPLQLVDLTVDTAGNTLEYLTNLGGENDNFELIQWQAGEGEQTEHTYEITFTGKPLSFLAGIHGDHPNNGLNYLIINNSTEGTGSTITAVPGTVDITSGGASSTATIEKTLTGNQSLVVTNVPSGVTWTVKATDAKANDIIWTGDGLAPTSPVQASSALQGTTIASTSVTATCLPANSDPLASDNASLTVQNRVVDTSEQVTADNIVPIDKTYPFTVAFKKGTVESLPSTVNYINSTGRAGKMTLSNGVTPSFILNSGDSITFFGLPAGLEYEVVPATALGNNLTWITGGASGTTSTDTTAQGSLLNGDTLVTAQYIDAEAVAQNQSYYYAQSTPCRLFYSVGVEDAVLYPSGNVNVGALDVEYVQTHTETRGDGSNDRYNRLYFISNWFDQNNDATLDSGVPAMTFSPAADNRYYVFQKNLPLYEVPSTAEGGGAGDDGGGGSGGDETPPSERILNGDDSTVLEGGMQLKVDGKTYNAVNDLNSLIANGLYYIVIEYYLPSANGGGRFVQMALLRTGSQFGANINTDVGTDKEGKYLCWYNMQTGEVQNILDVTDAEGNPINPSGGNWVIATRVNGLRTGNMENNQQPKNPNTTLTANDYFYPTASSGSGSGTVSDKSQFNNEINVYLGNNGKLYIADTKLLMTKLVVNPEDAKWAENGEAAPLTFTEYEPSSQEDKTLDTEYSYQVFVAGATGYRDATVVLYDQASGLWCQAVSTLSVQANNAGLLLNSDNTTLAVVDKDLNRYYSNGNGGWNSANGDQVPGESVPDLYYVFCGRMGGGTVEQQNSYLLYSSALNDDETPAVGGMTIYGLTGQPPQNVTYEPATADSPAGTRDYWANSVELVPINVVGESPNTWQYPSQSAPQGAVQNVKFTFATMYLDHDYALRSGINVESPFAVTSTFLTKRLFFG